MLRHMQLKEVRDKHQNILYQHQDEARTNRIISKAAVTKMNQVMMQVMIDGTGNNAAIGRPAAGKTGTSQNFRDAWFIGYTPQIVVGVWLGK